MLEVFIYIISVFLFAYLAYFVIMAFGVFRKREIKLKFKKNNFFAILVAARNEELVIGNLIDSLKRQNYPKDSYEIFVIVNNCTDNTKKVAKDAGATVIDCNEKVKSKGDVLKFAFEKLKNNKEIDAYVIFDADNIVHSEFLKKMNDILNSGYSVAQGFRDSKNVSDNWLSSSYTILYYIQSLFINRARFNLGKSSFLNGTGFMVKKEVIDKHGFNPVTLTEDIEFTAMCAVNDEKIAFVEDAITYDEQVVKFRDSLKQRKRWSFGTIQCLKHYGLSLVKKGIKDKKLECFDIVLFYFSIILQIISVFIPILTLIFLIFNFQKISFNFVFICICFTFAFYIIGVLFRMMIIKKCGKKIKDMLGGILWFDIFLFSWIPVSFLCLFKRDCSWDQIKHDRNIRAGDLEF